jgi:hypothetical protein
MASLALVTRLASIRGAAVAGAARRAHARLDNIPAGS